MSQNCSIFERLCRRCFRKVVPDTRKIAPGFQFEEQPLDENPNRAFANNIVRTTKYTILTFLPLNLWEQLHRYANLFFIFIVILNFMPDVAAFAKEVAPLPVVIMMGIKAVKDAWEDYRRYTADKRVNKKKCTVYRKREGGFVADQCQNLLPGDIIQLAEDEVIPADILLLHSSDPAGICYIETSNLDGETNLKQRGVGLASNTRAGRRASRRKHALENNTFDPSSFCYNVEVEQPHAEINRFEGKILFDENETKSVPIHAENLMLRGCKLKNTETIVGFVIYAGQETKASLNNKGARFKLSKLEKMINNSVIWCIVLLLIMCFCGAIANGIWTSGFSEPSTVIFLALDSDSTSSTPAMQAFINFWAYVVIYQSMVPLGLYLTIEFVKMGQIMYIEHDMQLYDPVQKTMAECKAWNITEDLGQIQYVFCDKTGTLTENEMVLKRCSINGMDYAEGRSPMTNGNAAATVNGKRKRDISPATTSKSSDSTVQKIPMERLKRKVNQVFVEQRLLQQQKEQEEQQQQQQQEEQQQQQQEEQQEKQQQDSRVIDYFLVLSLCNSVLVSVRKAQAAAAAAATAAHTKESTSNGTSNGIQMADLIGDENEDNAGEEESVEAAVSSRRDRREARRRQRRANQELTDSELQAAYISDSPDEAALVSAACRLGVKLLQRSPHRCVLWLPGQGPVRVRLLHTLPFDSERKRMSVVVRHPLTKEVTLLTKGADSVILNLLEASRSNDPNSDEERLRLHTELHLKSYADHGLRTLCLASRSLGSEEYADWLAQHRRADQNISAGRGAALKRLACLLERDLRLVGVVGIEDRLQDGVQDTITSLRDAGMSVWVLTGDKQETALQVALEAKIRSSRQTLFRLNASESRADCRRLLNRYLDKLRRVRPPGANATPETAGTVKVRPELALVVDGDTLKYCLAKPKYRYAAVKTDVEENHGDVTLRSGADTSRTDASNGFVDDAAQDPENDDLRADFLRLAEQCGSVICCRAAPRQKAAVVALVKTKGVRILAIGDGANDVNMIQTADVGVGISGQEGMQAVMAADFSLARFRFLKRLLLVHGHWCYDRLARLALLLLYKNIMYCFLLFWFQVFNGFSGQVNIGQVYQLLFNLVMTSLPPLVMGILDKDIRDDVLMANPVLYRDSMNSYGYQAGHFWYNVSDAVWQSLVIFMVPYFAIADSNWDIFSFGDIVIGAAVVTAVTHNAIEVKGWMLVHWFSFVGSTIVGWLLIAMCVSAICTNCLHPENPYYQIIRNLSDPIFWLAQAAVLPLALAPRIVYRALDNTLSNSLTTQAMRLQHKFRFRNNPDLSKELRLPQRTLGIAELDINRSMRMRSTPLLPRGESGLGATFLEPSGQQKQQQQQQQQPQKQESWWQQRKQKKQQQEQMQMQQQEQRQQTSATPIRHGQHRRSRSEVNAKAAVTAAAVIA